MGKDVSQNLLLQVVCAFEIFRTRAPCMRVVFRCPPAVYQNVPQEGAVAETVSGTPANRPAGCGVLCVKGCTNTGKSAEQVGASVSFPGTKPAC